MMCPLKNLAIVSESHSFNHNSTMPSLTPKATASCLPSHRWIRAWTSRLVWKSTLEAIESKPWDKWTNATNAVATLTADLNFTPRYAKVRGLMLPGSPHISTSGERSRNIQLNIQIMQYSEKSESVYNIEIWWNISKLFQHLCCFQVISHDATYALLFETRLLPASPCVALCGRSCSVQCTKAHFKVSPTPMAKSANDAADRFC